MKRLALFVLLATITVTLRATATTFVWQSAVDGAWTDTANWNPGTGYPNDPADVAIFTNLYLPTNQVLTVTLPAGAVTVGVLRVLHASNTYVLTQGRLVLTNSALTNAVLYLASSYALTRPAYLMIRSEVEVLQDTLIAVAQYNLADGLQIAGPLHGSATITRGMSTTTGGNCTITNAASTYNGMLRVSSGYSTVVQNNALSNVAEVVVNYNGSFGSFGFDSIPKITINGVGQLTFSGGSSGSSYGVWTLNSTGAVFTTFAGRTLYGTLQGTGAVYFAGNTGMSLLGGIKPGGDDVGSLSFLKAGGTPILGSTASRAQLYIDVAGAGGVAGIDHDYLLVKNLVAALNLSNIVLHVSGNGGQTTNWFMEVPGTGTFGFVGTFFAVSNGPGVTSTVIYDPDNRRIGLLSVPEPALLLACALCAALACGWRSR